MPRRKRENYYQLSGRPHAGLDNPEKFGLTFDEVVDLIENKKWEKFYYKWYENHKFRFRLERQDYTCSKCGKRKPDPKDWKKDLRVPISDEVFCRKCTRRTRERKPRCESCKKELILNDLGLCFKCTEFLKEIDRCTKDLKDSILKLRDPTRISQET